MRNNIPILKFSSYTPKYNNTGVYLNVSGSHGGAANGAVWLHGILVLKPGEDEENWLRALNLTVVSEANQLARIAGVFSNRILLQRHFKNAVLENNTEVRVLPFSFNIRDVLKEGLYEDNFYIHVSARQYCSEPVRTIRAESALPSYLDTIESEDSRFHEADQLIRAYDAGSANRFSDAVEFFLEAVKNNDLRGDIDRPNLFNAAFCAGQAALETEPLVAEKLFDIATQWMEEDLHLRNNLLIQIQKLLISENEKKRKDDLAKKRSQLLQDLGFNKTGAAEHH